MEDVRAAESLLQRVVDWDGHFTEGCVGGVLGAVPAVRERARSCSSLGCAGHFDAHLVHVQRGVDRRLDGLRQQHLGRYTGSFSLWMALKLHFLRLVRHRQLTHVAGPSVRILRAESGISTSRAI